VQCLVIEVLKLVIEGMREDSNKIAEEEDKAVGKVEVDEGEAESEVELVPGKAPVLSILEVIFCLLIQKVPILNSNISGFHSTPTGSNDENDELVAEVVKCLEILPDVCSDKGNSKKFVLSLKIMRMLISGDSNCSCNRDSANCSVPVNMYFGRVKTK